MAANQRITDPTLVQPLAGNLRVLVIGLARDQTPTELRDEERLILWDSDYIKRSAIPRDVGIVLLTRFLDHGQFEQLKQKCAMRHIRIDKRAYSTGVLRQLLRVYLGYDQPVNVDKLIESDSQHKAALGHTTTQPTGLSSKLGAATIKIVPPKVTPLKYANVQEFIKGEFKLEPGENIKQASDRLYPRLSEFGLTGKATSFYATATKLAKDLGIVTSRSKPASEPGLVDLETLGPIAAPPASNLPAVPLEDLDLPVEAPVPAKPAPVSLPVPEITKQEASAADPGYTDALKMLDDAQAALQLAREYIVQLQAANKMLVSRHERLRKALESD